MNECSKNELVNPVAVQDYADDADRAAVPQREKEFDILKLALIYLMVSLFCALFGGIYELFSYGVYSYYMIYAFLIPLIFGSVPLTALLLRGGRLPGKVSLGAWNAGVAALTTGCLFRGVLEIYGTTNRLIAVYFVTAGLLMAAGLVIHITKGWISGRRDRIIKESI